MRIIVLTILTAVLFCMPALAAEDFGAADVGDALPEEAREILGDMTVNDALDTRNALSRIRDYLRDALGDFIRDGVSCAAAILAVVVLCTLAQSFAGSGAAAELVPLGGVLAVSAAAAEDFGAFIGLGVTAIERIAEFSRVLLPTMTMAAAAGGAVTSAPARFAATSLFVDVLLTAASDVIMPLIYAYIALVVASAALGNGALGGALKLVKWLCVTLLSGLVLCFTLYLTVTGVIADTADATAAKLAKTAISAALPVVGGIIADAAGTVVSGAAVLRNAVGVFGLLAVVCVCIVPFLTLGIHYLVYKAVAALSAAISDGRLSELISGLGTAFGMVLGLTGAGAVMLYISIISCIKAVGGV